MKESPIFIKCYELIMWILQHTPKFPRSQRFLMAQHEDVADGWEDPWDDDAPEIPV